MTKHGNISIEPTLGGYYIFAINMPEDKIYVSEAELDSLFICLYKLKETKNFNN